MGHPEVQPPHSLPHSTITAPDIVDLTAIAHKLTGITLSDRPSEFLTARLGRRLSAHGLSDYASYRQLLLRDQTERLEFAEALTTHTTSFFRERAQFDWLVSEGYAQIASVNPGREITVWSAACSTGQEGYTAMMVAQQARDMGLWDLNARLIGTDISRPVLRTAARAIYAKADIETIPIEMRRRFVLSSRLGDGRYRIAPELRSKTTWRAGNLVTGEGLDGLVADIIFLRNILIYFDDDVRRKVIDTVYRRLRPGGFLLTGHTEVANARREGLVPVRPAIFRKVTP